MSLFHVKRQGLPSAPTTPCSQAHEAMPTRLRTPSLACTFAMWSSPCPP